MTECEELKRICNGIVEYLKNKHPYCYVVISLDEIKLVETTIGVPLCYTKD